MRFLLRYNTPSSRLIYQINGITFRCLIFDDPFIFTGEWIRFRVSIPFIFVCKSLLYINKKNIRFCKIEIVLYIFINLFILLLIYTIFLKDNINVLRYYNIFISLFWSYVFSFLDFKGNFRVKGTSIIIYS